MKVRLGVMETKRITNKPAVGGKQGRRGEDGRGFLSAEAELKE